MLCIYHISIAGVTVFFCFNGLGGIGKFRHGEFTYLFNSKYDNESGRSSFMSWVGKYVIVLYLEYLHPIERTKNVAYYPQHDIMRVVNGQTNQWIFQRLLLKSFCRSWQPQLLVSIRS